MNKPRNNPTSVGDVKALVHDLEVHQVELEMQNDELRRVQGELEASRARYFDLYDLAPVGYLTVDEDGVILEANLTAAAMLGVNRSKFPGHPIYAHIHPDDRDAYYLYRRRLFETKTPQACDLRLLRRGDSFWAHLTSTVSTDHGLAVCRVVLVDISERKEFEVTLDAERERLAVTLESIADGIVTTDARGNVVSLNSEAEKLTGWSHLEAVGHPVAEVYHALDPDNRVALIAEAPDVLTFGQALKTPKPTVLVSRDGTERAIIQSGAPIRSASGRTLGAVVVFRDITERLQFLEASQRTDKLEALGVLAGGIAHDFNNLLGGIFGYITMARDLGDPGPATIKYLDKAGSVFHRAQALTRQLLTFSRGGAPDRQLGDLGALVRETAEFALSGSNVVGLYSLPKDLWPCDFDRHQMGQVVDNLVINSRQAMPAGGAIRISAENVVLEASAPLGKSGRYLRLEFSDDGEGIHPGDLHRVFDPFFTTKKAGTGLGLATCHSIVVKHEGALSVRSERGKGCTFEILLPAAQKGTVSAEPSLASSHRGSGTILLMDDEAMMREIVGRVLSNMGYTVVEVGTGSEALEALAAGTSLCAAILDLTIRGGIGGADTVKALRQRLPGLPVFASSGFSEDPIMSRPGEYGFTDSIRKPYRKEDLAALLEKHRVGQGLGGPPG